MLLDKVAELPEALASPPPADEPLLLKKAELPEKVQLVIIGAEMIAGWPKSLVVVLYIPPPADPAEFPEKMQLTTLGEEPWLNIPPPAWGSETTNEYEFPRKMQLVMIGEELIFAIPPPNCAAILLINMQLLTVGEPELLSIPPPHCPPTPQVPVQIAFPPVTVKPSSMAVLLVPEPVVTW